MEKVIKFWEWLSGTRLMRAVTRYGMARGDLLAGGVAYVALFSIFAALAIAWTVFMAVLGSNVVLRQSVIEAINTALPGTLDTGDGKGIINPANLVLKTAFNLTSIIAIVILLWSALAAMTALRVSVQSMFGIAYLPENFLIGKLRDLLGFILLGSGVLISAVLTTLGTSLGGQLLGGIGLNSPRLMMIISLLVSVLVGWLLLVLIFRVISGVRCLAKDIWWGTLPGAILTGLLGLAGTSLIGSVSKNPLLAGFAALVTLLLWVNLSVRVILYTAAFVANPPRPAYPDHPQELHSKERPNYVTISEPNTLNWPHEPLLGTVVPDASLDPTLPKLPKHAGFKGKIQKRWADFLTRRAQKAQDRYYQGQVQRFERQERRRWTPQKAKALLAAAENAAAVKAANEMGKVREDNE